VLDSDDLGYQGIDESSILTSPYRQQR
jgi:cell division cycle 20-like protein 1, cofactor of APC complex